MNELFDQDLAKGTKAARYGWIIDTDHLHDLAQEPAENNDAEVMGPANISRDINDRLLAGEGRQFKMYDDDNELYYTGRILTADPDDEGSELDFGPLDDFGRPNAGATEIHYFNEKTGRWTEL